VSKWVRLVLHSRLSRKQSERCRRGGRSIVGAKPHMDRKSQGCTKEGGHSDEIITKSSGTQAGTGADTLVARC